MKPRVQSALKPQVIYAPVREVPAKPRVIKVLISEVVRPAYTIKVRSHRVREKRR